jgi:hypothetical protein
MSDQTKPVSRPWRRFLRFSMRGLIVLVLVVGTGLGWLIRSARIQRDAVAAITRAGGSVQYNWEWANGEPIAGGRPAVPKRMIDLIGLDYLGHVTRVSYMQRAIDSMNARVAKMNAEFSALVAARAELAEAQAKPDPALGHADGEAVTHLKPLASIKSPESESQAFMADLTRLPQLSSLDLSFTDVTDDGLAHLKVLTSLSELNLMHTRITDSGLAHLKGLSNLSHLRLGDGFIAAGFRVEESLKPLFDLPPITDAGLAHLEGLTNLSELDLSATEITDAGLVHLKALANLRSVDLRGTHITNAGAQELQRALPRLKLVR